MIGLILFLVGSKGEQNENNKKDCQKHFNNTYKCNLVIWTKNDITC